MNKSLLSAEKFNSLLALAQRAKALPGNVAELGVFQGGALRALAELMPDKTCYGFDTFEGLPEEHWNPSEPHRPGEFSNTSYDRLLETLPSNCKLVRGLFPESAVIIEDRFCLAHVDFDFEEGTRAAIEWLLPRMTTGGIIVFDDYRWPNCPGVESAILKAGLIVTPSAPFQCVYQC